MKFLARMNDQGLSGQKQHLSDWVCWVTEIFTLTKILLILCRSFWQILISFRSVRHFDKLRFGSLRNWNYRRNKISKMMENVPKHLVVILKEDFEKWCSCKYVSFQGEYFENKTIFNRIFDMKDWIKSKGMARNIIKLLPLKFLKPQPNLCHWETLSAKTITTLLVDLEKQKSYILPEWEYKDKSLIPHLFKQLEFKRISWALRHFLKMFYL